MAVAILGASAAASAQGLDYKALGEERVWLCEIVERMHHVEPGRGEGDSVSRLTLKLTPRPDLHYARVLEQYLRP